MYICTCYYHKPVCNCTYVHVITINLCVIVHMYMFHSLTQEEARENWEKFGNPDGPRAASFGIALPSWIVDKNNSLWVGVVTVNY